jgi:hypothetical protein
MIAFSSLSVQDHFSKALHDELKILDPKMLPNVRILLEWKKRENHFGCS